MKIVDDNVTLENFDAWSGAVDTKQRIIDADKESDFEAIIEELYPDGLTDTQLNDILWFEDEWIYEMLGIEDDEDDEDETYILCLAETKEEYDNSDCSETIELDTIADCIEYAMEEYEKNKYYGAYVVSENGENPWSKIF